MSGSCCSGSHRSGGSARSVSPKNPGGVTPATVNDWPSMTSVDPTTDASPAYTPCQVWYASMTTGEAAGASSASV